MIWRLINHNDVLPGAFRYEDRQMGSHRFGPNEDIDKLAAEVSSFRTANKLKRATVEECLIDVDRFNAARVGGNPRWCVPVDSEVIHSEAAARRGTGCKGCGAVAD